MDFSKVIAVTFFISTGGYTINQSGYYQPADGSNAEYPAVQTPQQATSGYDWGNQQQQQYTADATQTYGDQQMGGNYAPFQVSHISIVGSYCFDILCELFT